MSCTLTWRAGALALFAVAASSFAAEPIWDGNRVERVAESLAPGAIAFYAADARDLNAKGGAAATSSGLIVGRRGALLVDTMLNRRLDAQVLALARKATALPLLYAVNTSAHGDHSYGNMYLPASVRVIQSAVIAARPALPWLLDGHLVETLDTLRSVYAFLPADARVVPGHGVRLGREDLRWHIDYLAEVQRQVRSAVDQRLTLGQTVRSTARKETA
jgi:glyoxylase-like metal-dependent hydrolase (beta-lactamase superfamily II)